MSQTVEKPAPPAGKTEYDNFLKELPQINKEINSIIIRNKITQDLLSSQSPSITPGFKGGYTNNLFEGTEHPTIQKEERDLSLLTLFEDAEEQYEKARQALNNTKPHLELYNIAEAKKSLTDSINALKKDDLTPVINRVKEFKKQLADKNSELNKSLSKTEGTQFPEVEENFLQSVVKQQNLINAVVAKIEKGLALQSKDVLKRVVLENAGFVEDPKNPGTFVDPGNVEKDPWGIRFTIASSVSGAQTVSTANDILNKQYNAKNKAQSKSQESTKDSTQEAKNAININADLLDNVSIDRRSSYYMNLLPAIRSNLPIQGGTDVPGAQPGLNFKIQHSIVKHKVPGFSPIYQPMGVESIRCTIVGCFTGADGTDIWSPGERAKDRATNGRTTIPLEFTGRGDSFESLTKNVQTIEGPSPISDFVGLTRSYDAFQNAQEFYNQVVKDGKLVEVEINLKKNDMVSTGGTDGPFRNSVSGNPFFKALIRQMDLYYVRADRCWYILDLEITDAGIIGKKCLNLTTNINAAADLLLEAQQALEETDQLSNELIGCIETNMTDPLILHSEKKGRFKYVIDRDTGYGFKEDFNGNKEIIRPKDIGPLFAEANSGGSNVNTGNIAGNLLDAIPGVRDFTGKAFGRVELNREYARILLKHNLIQPKDKNKIFSDAEANKITSGKAFRTKPSDKGLLARVVGKDYYWDPTTRQFYNQAGLFGGSFDPADRLSLRDFLSSTENQYWASKELTELLSQIQDLSEAEDVFIHRDAANNELLKCLAKFTTNIPSLPSDVRKQIYNDPKNVTSREHDGTKPRGELVDLNQDSKLAGSEANFSVDPDSLPITTANTDVIVTDEFSADDLKTLIETGWTFTLRKRESSTYTQAFKSTRLNQLDIPNRLGHDDFKIVVEANGENGIFVSEVENVVYVKTRISNKSNKDYLLKATNSSGSITIGKGETTVYTRVLRNNHNKTDFGVEGLLANRAGRDLERRFDGFATEGNIERLLNGVTVNKTQGEEPLPAATQTPTVAKENKPE